MATPIIFTSTDTQEQFSWGTAVGNAVWPTANKAFFFPIFSPVEFQVNSFQRVAGAVNSGNLDMGIYDTAGNLLASIGSTAQAGSANTNQKVSLATPVILEAGLYYLAMAADNVTGSTTRIAGALLWQQTLGYGEMTSAFPLPNPATIVVITAAYLPIFGINS